MPGVRAAPAAWPEACAAGRRAIARTDRRPGARHARARDRDTVERPERRPPTGVVARKSRGFLRRAPIRDHPDWPLLSGPGTLRRSAAATGVRSALAPAPQAFIAEHRAHVTRGPVRSGVLLGRPAQGDSHGHSARHARVLARLPAAAASVPAEHALAASQSVVRAGCDPCPATTRTRAPRAVFRDCLALTAGAPCDRIQG